MSELEAKTTLDLDGLIVEPVQFKLLNKVREIKPIDLEAMFKFTNAMEHISELATKKANSKELLDGYYSIFAACVEPFTMDDLLAMTAAQMMSLYGLILRRIYGEDLAKTFEQKKKTRIPTSGVSQSRFHRLRLWVRRVFFLDGSPKSV